MGSLTGNVFKKSARIKIQADIYFLTPNIKLWSFF